ncbi:sulfur globule protein CV3 domain protein, partial [Oesophagostomum dentatum]
GYSPYFHGYYPYGLASPVVHAAAPFYSPFLPYSVYSPFFHPHRELHNVAGAVQRENELLTDVSLRFPAKNAKTL